MNATEFANTIKSWGSVRFAVFPTLNPKKRKHPIRLLDSEFRIYAILFEHQGFRTELRSALDGVGISVTIDEPDMPDEQKQYTSHLLTLRRTRAFVEFAATVGPAEIVHRPTGETTLYRLTGQLRTHVATIDGLLYEDLRRMSADIGGLEINQSPGCACTCAHLDESKAGSSEIRDSVEPSDALQRCPTLIGQEIDSRLFTETRQRSQVCEPLPVPASTPKPVCEDNDL